MTDAEKATWNGKASSTLATTGASGLMTAADKVKLNGVATNANNYTHPSTHAISQVSGLQGALEGKVNATVDNGLICSGYTSGGLVRQVQTEVKADRIGFSSGFTFASIGLDGIIMPSSAVINMPCVALAGYGVLANGNITYRYGAKIDPAGNATRPAGTTGVYVIPHNIGHANYNLDISIQTADNDYFYVWKEIKSARTLTTTRIKIAQVGGGLSNVDFTATFTGKNY